MPPSNGLRITLPDGCEYSVETGSSGWHFNIPGGIAARCPHGIEIGVFMQGLIKPELEKRAVLSRN